MSIVFSNLIRILPLWRFFRAFFKNCPQEGSRDLFSILFMDCAWENISQVSNYNLEVHAEIAYKLQGREWKFFYFYSFFTFYIVGKKHCKAGITNFLLLLSRFFGCTPADDGEMAGEARSRVGLHSPYSHAHWRKENSEYLCILFQVKHCYFVLNLGAPSSTCTVRPVC